MKSVMWMALVLAGCGPSDEDAAEDTTGTDTGSYSYVREAVSDGGSWSLSYVPSPDPIPPVDNFGLTLQLVDAESGDAVVGAALEMDATMPEHNHGMNTRPPVVEVGEGTYRVEGMQFHMSGHWQLEFRILHQDAVETAVFHAVCCE